MTEGEIRGRDTAGGANASAGATLPRAQDLGGGICLSFSLTAFLGDGELRLWRDGGSQLECEGFLFGRGQHLDLRAFFSLKRWETGQVNVKLASSEEKSE